MRRSPSSLLRLLQSFVGVAAAAAAGGLVLAHCGEPPRATSGSDGGGSDATGDTGTTPAEAGSDSAMADSGTVDSSVQDSGADSSTADVMAQDSATVDSSPPVDAAVDTGIPCDDAGMCSGALTCCTGTCVDLHHDPRHCYACGVACTSTQFCTPTGCDEAVFTNVCVNGAATVVNDPYTPDNDAGATMGYALQGCTDAGIALAIVPQTQPGVLIPDGDAGWQPNTGVGNTLVAGGSWWGQLSVAYMDDHALTPVYFTNDGYTSKIFQRATGLTLVSTPDSMLTANHDYFILEMAVEPQSGTLCLFGQGIFDKGTTAAAYIAATQIIPDRANHPAPWYVYEWVDGDMDGVPNAADTYNLIASGP